ncbi:transporter substrate-binding domain-containing protein [uncultured Shewanella sp.]|uniref:transporter substrate-binding domain-containing protein n=1 Tax=uncultured Shewanella sp. TaxID=173975 RepID=UPI002634D5B0|nr:transporter substrate-binding domain-containing protein [uncultured Shewanella sp.]
MKILVYFMFILGSYSLASFVIADEEGRDKDLILGMDGQAYPLQFIDEMGKPAGLLVDRWRLWAKETQTQIQFTALENNEVKQSLMDKKIDLHIGVVKSNKPIDSQFAALAALTSVNHYLYLHQALSVPNDIKTLSAFTIGVVRGSSAASVLETDFTFLRLHYYADRNALLLGAEKSQVYIIAATEGLLASHQAERQVTKGLQSYHLLLLKQSLFHPWALSSQLPLIEKVSQLYTNNMATALLTQKWLGKGQGQAHLTLGLPLAFAPYASIGIDGLAHGLLVDIWHAWSQQSGVKVDFVFDEHQANVKALNAGRLDGILAYFNNGMSQPTFNKQQSVYQMKMRLFSQFPMTDLSLLAGQSVAMSRDFESVNVTHKGLSDVNIVYMDDMKAMIKATENNDVIGFIAPSALTQHYLLLAQKWDRFYQDPSLTFNVGIGLITAAKGINAKDNHLLQLPLLSAEKLADIERRWIVDKQDYTLNSTSQRGLINASEKAYLTQLKRLKIGYLANWKPMEFTNNQGEFSGINSDVFARISTDLGLTIEPVAFEHWNELLTALYQGEVDMAGSVANIPERQHQLLFSQSYWPSSWGVLTHLDAVNFFHLEDLSGLRVAVVEGYHLVPTFIREHPTLQLVLVSDIDAGIDAMTKGNADVFIDKLVNLGIRLKQRRSHTLKLALLVDLSQQRSHIGIHPKHALLPPLINKVLSSMDASVQRKIQDKWVKSSLPVKGVHQKTWLDLIVVMSLVLVSLLVLIWLVRYGKNQT